MLFELNLFTTFLLSHLLIGTGLILALIAVIRMCDLSAELQSWLWTTAFAICVLVPALSLAPTNVQTVPAATQAAKVQPLPLNPARAVTGKTSTNKPAVSPIKGVSLWVLPGRWVKKAISGIYALLSIWLLGGIWRAITLVLSIRRTRALVQAATPYRESVESTVTCPLLISDKVSAPMAAGLFNPVILLPSTFVERIDAERIAPIILHEWAHIRRRDLWVGALQEVVAILFWWSPVIRLINRKIHVSRELACDMRAARMLQSGKRFAQSLLDCAELMINRRQSVLAMSLFCKKKDLTERINAVLKFKHEKTPKLLITATACSFIAAASLGIAQEYGPRINLASITGQAQYASGLSRAQGEKLMAVVRSGNIAALEEMLHNGLDINAPVLGEGTALIEAVRQNNREMAELLIGSGADVNLPALGDGNPMIAAAQHNRMELAELLFQRGADLDAVVPRDGTPLIVAIRSGHDAMAQQLIDWGADVNRAARWDGSPLIAAAMAGNLEIAKELQRAGADINGVVETDETPLINASHHGHFDVVKFLVESGADVNLGVMANGNEFRTPLNRAQSSEIRNYLIAMGATE